eukprot:343457_1
MGGINMETTSLGASFGCKMENTNTNTQNPTLQPLSPPFEDPTKHCANHPLETPPFYMNTDQKRFDFAALRLFGSLPYDKQCLLDDQTVHHLCFYGVNRVRVLNEETQNNDENRGSNTTTTLMQSYIMHNHPKAMNLPIQTLPDTNQSMQLLKSIHKIIQTDCVSEDGVGKCLSIHDLWWMAEVFDFIDIYLTR